MLIQEREAYDAMFGTDDLQEIMRQQAAELTASLEIRADDANLICLGCVRTYSCGDCSVGSRFFGQSRFTPFPEPEQIAPPAAPEPLQPGEIAF
jgi:hypothetical protein